MLLASIAMKKKSKFKKIYQRWKKIIKYFHILNEKIEVDKDPIVFMRLGSNRKASATHNISNKT